jgi:hypothetical protein
MRLRISVALVALSATPLMSQTVSLADPGDIAREFFQAVAQERWRDAAGFVNLARIDSSRTWAMHYQRRPQRIRPVSVEDLMRRDTTLPRAVAEYQVAQMERMRADALNRGFSHEWANVRDTVELQALTTLDLGARWLEAQDARAGYRQDIRASNCVRPGVTEEMLLEGLVPRREVLGVIVRGDTAFAVHRGTAVAGQFTPMSEPRIATLIRRQGAWLIEADHTLIRTNVMFASMDCREDGSAAGRRRPN